MEMLEPNRDIIGAAVIEADQGFQIHGVGCLANLTFEDSGVLDIRGSKFDTTVWLIYPVILMVKKAFLIAKLTRVQDASGRNSLAGAAAVMLETSINENGYTPGVYTVIDCCNYLFENYFDKSSNRIKNIDNQWLNTLELSNIQGSINFLPKMSIKHLGVYPGWESYTAPDLLFQHMSMDEELSLNGKFGWFLQETKVPIGERAALIKKIYYSKWYKRLLADTTERMQADRKKISSLSADLEQANTHLLELTSSLNHSVQELNIKNEEFQEASRSVTQLKAQVNKLTTEKNNVVSSNHSLKKELDETKKANFELNHELNHVNSQLKGASSKIKELEQENSRLKNHYNERHQNLNKMLATLGSISDSANEKIRELQTQIQTQLANFREEYQEQPASTKKSRGIKFLAVKMFIAVILILFVLSLSYVFWKFNLFG